MSFKNLNEYISGGGENRTALRRRPRGNQLNDYLNGNGRIVSLSLSAARRTLIKRNKLLNREKCLPSVCRTFFIT